MPIFNYFWIQKNFYFEAFLAEPGYNAQARTISMRHDGSGPTLNFKFCDEAPWNFDKVIIYIFTNILKCFIFRNKLESSLIIRKELII